MKKRYALLLANSEYSDLKLSHLPVPGEGSEGLAQWLRDPKGGAFQGVEVVSGATMPQTLLSIERFFGNKGPEDLLFLWFGGHAIIDSQGEAFLCLSDSDRLRLKSSAIMAAVLAMHMDTSPSQDKLLVLDCRFHSFVGHRPEAEERPMLRLQRAFIGRGNAKHVLASDPSLHLHAHVDAESALRPPHPFTRALTAIWRDQNQEVQGLALSDLYPALSRRLGHSHKPEWFRIGDAVDLILAPTTRTELVAAQGQQEAPDRSPRDLESLDWNTLSGEIPLDILGLDFGDSRPRDEAQEKIPSDPPGIPPISGLRGPMPDPTPEENPLASIGMPVLPPLELGDPSQVAIAPTAPTVPIAPIAPALPTAPTLSTEPPAPTLPVMDLPPETPKKPEMPPLPARPEPPVMTELPLRPGPSKSGSRGPITADVSDLLDQTMAMAVPAWVREENGIEETPLPEAKQEKSWNHLEEKKAAARSAPAKMDQDKVETAPIQPLPFAMEDNFAATMMYIREDDGDVASASPADKATEKGRREIRAAASPHGIYHQDARMTGTPDSARESAKAMSDLEQSTRLALAQNTRGLPWAKIFVWMLCILLPLAFAGYLLVKSGLLERLNWVSGSRAEALLNPGLASPSAAAAAAGSAALQGASLSELPVPVKLPAKALGAQANAPEVLPLPQDQQVSRALKTDLLKVVDREAGQLKSLYERYVLGYPGLKGVVRVRLEISPDGRIRNARSVGSTTELPAFDNDVARSTLGWKVSGFRGQRSKFVTLPLRFPLGTDND